MKILLILTCLALTGCQHYRGLIPDKNVNMKGVLIQGSMTGVTIQADEITTTLVCPHCGKTLSQPNP